MLNGGSVENYIPTTTEKKRNNKNWGFCELKIFSINLTSSEKGSFR